MKRALEIAAAGPQPSSSLAARRGKSMLAKRLATILPPLTLDEALETTKIHSIVGLLPTGLGLITRRHFVHHITRRCGIAGR